MKKLLALCLTVILILTCITACSNGANRFYNGKEYENRYIFVFSNELSESNGLLNKCEIEVRYNPDNEEYNSCVSISHTNNAWFSYTLINGLEDGFKP